MEGRWERRGIIGKGAFGTVNLAQNRTNGTIFAVKSINLNSSPPRAIAALENEIRLLSSLKSPHIVSYLADDVTDEHAGSYRNLHLEYLPGGTAAAAAAAGKMTENDVRSYTRSITQALHYLHTTAGVVHGDVKGRNVILGSRSAKLADFGSAKSADFVSADFGTPLWMAPEVARGDAATSASDVWSLGCTVIEMVSGGRNPWGESDVAIGDPIVQMLRIGFGEGLPEYPNGLSKAGKDFVDKCLRRDAGERWSCEELLRHCFVADWLLPSPRSVLEMEEMEIEYEEDEDGDEVELVRERIRDLGSLEVEWGGEEWVEVRKETSDGRCWVEDRECK